MGAIVATAQLVRGATVDTRINLVENKVRNRFAAWDRILGTVLL